MKIICGPCWPSKRPSVHAQEMELLHDQSDHLEHAIPWSYCVLMQQPSRNLYCPRSLQSFSSVLAGRDHKSYRQVPISSEESGIQWGAPFYIRNQPRPTAVSSWALTAVFQKLPLYASLPLTCVPYVRKAIYDKVSDQTYTMLLPDLEFGLLKSGGNSQESTHLSLGAFLINLPINVASIIKQADPVGLVNRLFPSSLAPEGARYVAACFWSWLCVLDGQSNISAPGI